MQLIFDSSGKSKGTAFVIFANPSDAQKAIKEYHNRPFDGQPMKLELIYKVNRDDYISLSANNKGPSGGRFRRNLSSFGIGRRGYLFFFFHLFLVSFFLRCQFRGSKQRGRHFNAIYMQQQKKKKSSTKDSGRLKRWDGRLYERKG